MFCALPLSISRGCSQHICRVQVPSSFNGSVSLPHLVPFSSQQLLLPSYFSLWCQDMAQTLWWHRLRCVPHPRSFSPRTDSQPQLNWHKDPDVQSAKYSESPCQRGDLIDGISKGAEKYFDPTVTILRNSCQQDYHIKMQPLLERCIEQKNGRICIGCMYLILPFFLK